MRSLFTSLILLLASLLLPQCHAQGIVAAYLPDYRDDVNINNTATLLTDLYLFSIDPDSEGNLEGRCCLQKHHYQRAREARAHRHHFHPQPLKLWVSIGGAGRSSGLPSIAASPNKRKAFLKNLLKLCKEEHLDGVDFNWEPLESKDQYNEYVQLLLETAQVLHSQDILLSVTTREKMPPQVLESVDRVQFMAYDLNFWGPKHHADFNTVTKVINFWFESGFYIPEKVILGIPCYARHMDDASRIKTFAELVDDGLKEDTVDEYKGYLFDSPKTIRKKLAYVKKNALGGVFLWELGHDKQLENYPGGWLLHAASGRKATKEEL
jgi:GH18 family chitinase